MDHHHSDKCIGVEIRGVYDGILYWLCDDGRPRNRWHLQDRKLYAAARKYMADPPMTWMAEGYWEFKGE